MLFFDQQIDGEADEGEGKYFLEEVGRHLWQQACADLRAHDSAQAEQEPVLVIHTGQSVMGKERRDRDDQDRKK